MVIPSHEHTPGLLQSIFKVQLWKKGISSTSISGLMRETSPRSQSMTKVTSGRQASRLTPAMQVLLALSHLRKGLHRHSVLIVVLFTKKNLVWSGLPSHPPPPLLIASWILSPNLQIVSGFRKWTMCQMACTHKTSTQACLKSPPHLYSPRIARVLSRGWGAVTPELVFQLVINQLCWLGGNYSYSPQLRNCPQCRSVDLMS